jgi:hypothetical protein
VILLAVTSVMNSMVVMRQGEWVNYLRSEKAAQGQWIDYLNAELTALKSTAATPDSQKVLQELQEIPPALSPKTQESSSSEPSRSLRSSEAIPDVGEPHNPQ